MKLLQVYNQYRSPFNGEEAVVELTAALVEKHGGTARLLRRSSRDIPDTLLGKAHAFWSGVYSHEAYREMARVLTDDQPDIVHVHNLYPLFSPSILVACRRANVPVVMSVHNQQLTCPRADHLYRGEICERCVGGGEYHCVLKNCRQNLFESVAYALRSAFARKQRLFHANVTLFLALSQFAKSRLVTAGFDAERIIVLPNMVFSAGPPADAAQGQYAAFAGRLSAEKGLSTLLSAAAALPQCPVRIAGSGPLSDTFSSSTSAHVSFDGQLETGEMPAFYRHARFVVMPSLTFEMCPLVILEAMSHGIPVITSRRGAQNELVEDGVTGLLFEPGDSADLQRQMRRLWENPALCRELGLAGYERVVRDHSEDGYYRRLIAAYDLAIALANERRSLPQVIDELTGVDRELIAEGKL